MFRDALLEEELAVQADKGKPEYRLTVAKMVLRRELASTLERLYDQAGAVALMCSAIRRRIDEQRLDYRPNSLGELQAAGAHVDLLCARVRALQEALEAVDKYDE